MCDGTCQVKALVGFVMLCRAIPARWMRSA